MPFYFAIQVQAYLSSPLRKTVDSNNRGRNRAVSFFFQKKRVDVNPVSLPSDAGLSFIGCVK